MVVKNCDFTMVKSNKHHLKQIQVFEWGEMGRPVVPITVGPQGNPFILCHL